MNNSYNYGTGAYKLEQYEEQFHKSERKHKGQASLTYSEKATLCKIAVIAVMIASVVASAFIYINVMALRATTKIDALEKELALAVDKNKQKEIEINRNLDLNVIEKKAIEKLGMQKPDNNQIVYIDVKKGSYSEAVNPKSSTSSLMGGIKEFLISIKEYFSF